MIVKKIKNKMKIEFGKLLEILGMSEYYMRNFYKKGKLGQPLFSLSFDSDLEEDVKAHKNIVETLNSYKIRASFSCIGRMIEKFPTEHLVITDNGHEIINHTYTHPNNKYFNPEKKFNRISFSEREEEIKRCHEACKKVLNYEPIGFRSPHFGGLHTEDVYQILDKLNYRYSSSVISTYAPFGGMPFLREGVWEIPLSSLPKNCFLCFQIWGLYRGPKIYKNEQDFLENFRRLVDLGQETRSFINVYLDPCDVIRLGRGFNDMLEYVREKKITIMNYKKIVECLNEDENFNQE